MHAHMVSHILLHMHKPYTIQVVENETMDFDALKKVEAIVDVANALSYLHAQVISASARSLTWPMH